MHLGGQQTQPLTITTQEVDMTNKERIQTNNTNIDNCIKKASNLPDASSAIIESLEIIENGTYTAPDDVDGYSPVVVNVPIPDGYIIPSGEFEITENGTHDIAQYASVNVNVAGGGGEDSVKYIEAQYETVELPNATAIKKYAFYQDAVLKNISMPKVKKIDTSAFQNCKKLALTSLPSGITSIGNFAFYYCVNITLTSLPSTITSIGDSAFYGCGKLALTSLPSGVSVFQQSVFCGCTNLAISSIPTSVVDIGTTAFARCTSLTSITFEGTPSSIANNAFGGCTNLTTINVPWAEGAVANAPWGATNATINYNYTGE
jgi:hypothetical protein